LKIKEQAVLLKEKDKKIAELEAKLVDKESQRKELLSYLYKPRKKDRTSKPLGKVPGAPAYHRPIPKDDSVIPSLINLFPLSFNPLITH